MNSSNTDNEFHNDVEKYAVIPDFLEGVDLGPSTLETHLATPEVSYEEYCRKNRSNGKTSERGQSS